MSPTALDWFQIFAAMANALAIVLLFVPALSFRRLRLVPCGHFCESGRGFHASFVTEQAATGVAGHNLARSAVLHYERFRMPAFWAIENPPVVIRLLVGSIQASCIPELHCGHCSRSMVGDGFGED
jgi:hypothetical protein